MWMALLQTKIETQNILRLPRSYVPAVQGVLWYLLNDLFYFYPHWIAHSSSLQNSFSDNRLVIPQPVRFLHRRFKESHRLHHRCKANIGVAAWYCSVWEQLIFNLLPALIGPIATQLLADAAGIEQIWGIHLATLYIWLAAAAASSVLAHTGYRSMWNDPGKQDLHHERAFYPKAACNFGTFGFFDWLHGTASEIPAADTQAW
jgi:sterol desaturase/sphingolipid hydroxylase (fatty acid hydroxylase superfamily)